MDECVAWLITSNLGTFPGIQIFFLMQSHACSSPAMCPTLSRWKGGGGGGGACVP